MRTIYPMRFTFPNRPRAVHSICPSAGMHKQQTFLEKVKSFRPKLYQQWRPRTQLGTCCYRREDARLDARRSFRLLLGITSHWDRACFSPCFLFPQLLTEGFIRQSCTKILYARGSQGDFHYKKILDQSGIEPSPSEWLRFVAMDVTNRRRCCKIDYRRSGVNQSKQPRRDDVIFFRRQLLPVVVVVVVTVFIQFSAYCDDIDCVCNRSGLETRSGEWKTGQRWPIYDKHQILFNGERDFPVKQCCTNVVP